MHFGSQYPLEQVYFLAAAWLDSEALQRMDATCLYAFETNGAKGGHWWSLGRENFRGVELYGEGTFECPTGIDTAAATSWRRRHASFAVGLVSFGTPFGSPEITCVSNDDEVAYLRCLLRTDLLVSSPDCGVYLEIEVRTNPDNFSLAVVDFDEGGSSSLTFSPDTGAVISERKVCEAPRRVQGMYVQPLSAVAPSRSFQGSVGLYLRGGRMAFFRRCCGADSAPGAWESTGFVTDLSWAEGRRLTPCVAFRSAGSYEVRAERLSATPPFEPKILGDGPNAPAWASLDWEARDALDAEARDGAP